MEEIVRIRQGAHQEMERMNAESDIVLKGLRRIGMLQHRPDTVEQVLFDCDLDAIFTDMPVGSHMIRDKWLAERKHGC